MGRELFGVDIAGIVAEAFDGQLFEVTLTRHPRAQRDPANLTAGLQPGAPIVRTCQGFWEDFTGTPPPGVELELSDRKAILIGDTVPADFVPFLKDDSVTIEGQTLFNVKVLERDPAAAVYKLLCRDRGSGPL